MNLLGKRKKFLQKNVTLGKSSDVVIYKKKQEYPRFLVTCHLEVKNCTLFHFLTSEIINTTLFLSMSKLKLFLT